MITLADLFQVERLTRGRIVAALEATRGDIMQWCRSGAAGSVPPHLLAAKLLAALPDALSVPLHHLLARQVAAGEVVSRDTAVSLLSRPRLFVFASDGTLQFQIKLLAEICLTRAPDLPGDVSNSAEELWHCSGSLAILQDKSLISSVVSQMIPKDIILPDANFRDEL